MLPPHRRITDLGGVGGRGKTIRKYVKDGVPAPRYGPRAPRPCVVDQVNDAVIDAFGVFRLAGRRLA